MKEISEVAFCALNQRDDLLKVIGEMAPNYEQAADLWRRVTGRVHEWPDLNELLGWLLERMHNATTLIDSGYVNGYQLVITPESTPEDHKAFEAWRSASGSFICGTKEAAR